MIVGSLQMNVIKGDKVRNLETIEKHIDRAIDLVALPELFSTGYYFETFDSLKEAAEEIPNGFTTKRLIEIAKKSNCHFVGAIVEKEMNQFYITAVIVGPSGYIGKHRKRHITDEEAMYYTPGNQSDIYEINGCKVGVIVCFEGWFPESARDLMMKGAQVICYTLLTCQQRTLDIMRIRAIENKVYIVAANSISTEMHNNQSITFRGDSRVIDYDGNILIEAGKEEQLIAIAIDESKTMHKDLEDCKDLMEAVKKHPYL